LCDGNDLMLENRCTVNCEYRFLRRGQICIAGPFFHTAEFLLRAAVKASLGGARLRRHLAIARLACRQARNWRMKNSGRKRSGDA
jgi:hypothetical protein